MSEIDKMTPNELNDFLADFDFTNEDFAEMIGVTEACVDHWLHGRRKIPATTVRLIRFFVAKPNIMSEFYER